jgi:chaperone modulatory protein CbpM
MRLASIERDFDANEQLAAMVIDLMDEVRSLRAHQHALGIR